MSDLNKCFRCGMFDIDGVAVCRLMGHEIKQPMIETCGYLVQLDNAIDSLNENIRKEVERYQGFKQANKVLSSANSNINKENEKLKKEKADLIAANKLLDNIVDEQNEMALKTQRKVSDILKILKSKETTNITSKTQKEQNEKN